jgi:hypothetical protein
MKAAEDQLDSSNRESAVQDLAAWLTVAFRPLPLFAPAVLLTLIGGFAAVALLRNRVHPVP